MIQRVFNVRSISISSAGQSDLSVHRQLAVDGVIKKQLHDTSVEDGTISSRDMRLAVSSNAHRALGVQNITMSRNNIFLKVLVICEKNTSILKFRFSFFFTHKIFQKLDLETNN